MTQIKTDVMSVSALNHAIKLALEPGFRTLQVEGEVTNYRLQASGHEYFSLKDEKSQISCVFFKGFRSQSPLHIQPGDKIVIEGDLTVYEPRGTYQIVVKKAKKAGVGDLLMKIHELKKELESLGWCDPTQKKKLPPFPQTIGVITSPTGSVIQDIIHVLTRRFSGFQLLLNPVKVQGEGAAQEIATAIDEMNAHSLADVLIVGRGGGSLEDLMPFNERCVAKAIHDSHIPIISAVGHETDFSISDFVADIRAPTPSAAAEIAVKEKNSLIDSLKHYGQTLLKQLRHKLQEAQLKLNHIASSPLFSDPSYLLRDHLQKLDDLTFGLESHIQNQLQEKFLQLDGIRRQKEALNPLHKLKHYAQKCTSYSEQINRAIALKIEREEKKLSALNQLCQSINPKKLLSRGYCIPFAQNHNSVILSTKQLKPKDQFRLLMNDGEILSEVKEIP